MAPNENIYLWNHDRCLCKFVFCDFPDFSSRTILVSSDAVRFFLKSSYAEEERIFLRQQFCNNRDITVPF